MNLQAQTVVTGSGLCRIDATGLINGGFVQRNVETISQLREAATQPAGTTRRQLLQLATRERHVASWFK